MGISNSYSNSAASNSLISAIGEAVARYTSRTPKSRILFEKAQSAMPGGNTRSALFFPPYPVYVNTSHAQYITDVDGHEYLDVLGEYSAGLFGHSHPVLQRTILGTALGGFSNGAPSQREAMLADLLSSRFPGIASIRFCNSGTEANLYAMTLAKVATARSKILCFSGAYHGGVFIFAGGGHEMNIPFQWVVGRYNDHLQAAELIKIHSEDLAAVIVEPMLSNGGCIPAEHQFILALRQGCNDTGAVLIFDEIVTSRMGPKGMQAILGITPDLTTLGKYLGGGFSFGAFGGSNRLMDLFSPLRSNSLPHAGTFNNNAFSMAVGYAALSEVFTPDEASRLFSAGNRLRDRLNEYCKLRLPYVQFTGLGSILNIHFHEGPIARPEDLRNEPPELIRLFHFDLMERGIYAARRGQINLSLPMTDADLNQIFDAVVAILQQRAELISALARTADA